MIIETIFVAYSAGLMVTYGFLWATRMTTMNPIEALGLSLIWPATVVIYLLRGGWWK